MKKIGILLALTLLLVGCSAKEPAPKEPEKQEAPQPEEDSNEILSTALIELMKSDHYTMKMNTITDVEGEQMEVLTTTVVAGDQSATTMEMEGVSLTTILKDNKSYIVMHEQKMILETPVPDGVDQPEPGLDQIDLETLEYVGKGKGMFLENERTYEEYKMDVGIVKYYFDGKELDGMEIISDEMATIMDVEFFEDDVDMSVFDLPEDYTEVGN